MSSDNWLVEEEVKFDPTQPLDIRAVYIRLLQQLIDALKEPSFPPGTVKEELQSPMYTLPTVIFAYMNTDTFRADPHRALAQLICYRDRRHFLKELISYGEKDLIREYDLENFLRAEKEDEK